jgi:hypothetical protein
VEVVADRATVKAALERVEAAVDSLCALSLDALSPSDLLAVADRLQAVTRRSAVIDHQIVGRLVAECAPKELGAKSMKEVLARRLRISRPEAKRRIADANLLGPRTAMTGEVLDPVMPHVASGVAAGVIGAEHVAIIGKFFDHLPTGVDVSTRDAAEADLAEIAAGFTPEQLSNAADRLMCLLDPDGALSNGERSRKRGITIGKQQFDGMSPISGWLDPELRAMLDAVLAKLAAPGMSHPGDPVPMVAGTPSQEQVNADLRSPGQRNHDGLMAGLRSLLASGALGKKNGLPVSVIVMTTLQDLEKAAGVAITGGGSTLPMSDLLRMASQACHYLAIFDKHTNVPLYLGRSRRLASPGQRLMLMARDRGCTCPGCTVAAYWTEAHHVTEWRDDGQTDVDSLALACSGDHHLIGPDGWSTRMSADGRVEWIPPPELDVGGPITNDFHHPERFLTNRDSRARSGTDDEPCPGATADPDG